MRILATGGAGYVGSAAVRALLAAGHEVVVYDNLSRGHRGSVPAEVLVEGELADREALVGVMRERRIDAVLHFAAFIAVGESTEQPQAYYRNNVVNSLVLLEAMREADVGRIVFSSTAAVYAPGSNEPLHEESPKGPDSPYAVSKWTIERMIEAFAEAYGMGYTILRYFNACGADPAGRFGEDHRPETHLIPLVLQVPLGKRAKLFIFGEDYTTADGTCIRDYIHVDDLADAHIRAVEAMSDRTRATYNIGTGTGCSVREVIQAAESVVGESIPVEVVARRPGDTDSLVAASDRLQQSLGWSPCYTTLEAIIETAWQWHQSHPNGYAD